MFNTLLFPVLFLLLAALVCWVIIGCKGWWHAKFWLINITAVFVFILWSSVGSYLGWPYGGGIPDRFRLVGFVSNEPKCLYVFGESEVESGLGLKTLFSYKSDDIMRYYRLPYNKKMHEQLESAMERVNKGQYVIMSKGKILNSDDLKSITEFEGLFEESVNSADVEYYFYIMPPNKIFKKPEN
jgi:hypothetical protein